MASDADDPKAPPGYEPPHRSPHALPQPPVEWLPEVVPKEARPDFFRRESRSEWRRRNRKQASESQPRVILAYANAKTRR